MKISIELEKDDWLAALHVLCAAATFDPEVQERMRRIRRLIAAKISRDDEQSGG